VGARVADRCERTPLCARFVHDQVDGEVVDLLHVSDSAHRVGYIGALGLDAADGKDHVVGGERLAIMEFDVGPQVDAPNFGVRLLPFHRQRGDEFQVLAAPDEWLVNLTEPGERERLGECMRIERGGIDPIGVAERLGVGFADKEGDNEGKTKTPKPQHGAPSS